MSSEPERPIEKLLRARAKQKREQTGEAWEMQPATRRLLQQEVSRRFGRKPECASSRFGWLLDHGWVRPLTALGALVLIAVAIWISLPTASFGKKAALLAKNEPAGLQVGANPTPAAEVNQAMPQRLSPENPSGVSLLADNGRRQKQETGATLALQQTELAKAPREVLQRPVAATQAEGSTQGTVPAQLPAPSLAFSGERDAQPLVAGPSAAVPQRYGLPRELQPTAATSAEASASAHGTPTASPAVAQAENLGVQSSNDAPSARVVEYGYFAASQSANRTRPIQMLRSGAPLAGKAAPAANGILVSFRVEQSGAELRIIDRDGSIYAGPIQATSTELPVTPPGDQSEFAGARVTARPLANAAGLRDAKMAQQRLGQYLFQVVGTNRTSNQQVIFSGTLNADTNVLGKFAAKVVQPVSGRASLDDLSAAPARLQNLRLSGTAVIGRDEAIQIEAVPASPEQQRSQ